MAGRGEVVRFEPDGTLDRRIKVPAKTVTSVAFGGPDMSDLYVGGYAALRRGEQEENRLP